MSRVNILQIVSLFIYLFYQVLVLQNVVLFHTAFCFLYIAYLLLLPVETNPLILMIIGFAFGFAVDLFYESIGLHAFACVMLMYVRNYWLGSITPQGGYDNNAIPSMNLAGTQWFLVYTMPLIFIHHLVLFFVEAGGFGMFWYTLLKAIASTFFTTLALLIAQFLFPNKRR